MRTPARCLAIACALPLTLPAAATADISVTTTADTASPAGCSLREAINLANNDAPDASGCIDGEDENVDHILLPAGTYTIAIAGADEEANATGDFDVINVTDGASDEKGDLLIDGAGAGAGTGTIIDAANLDRAFDVQSSSNTGVDVHIKDLTIQNGVATAAGEDDGGAVLMRDANGGLTIENATVKNNVAGDWGGAISWSNANSGTGYPLEIIDSELIGNTAQEGGAIWHKNGGGAGAMRINRSLLTGNTATGGDGVGGAVYLRGQSGVDFTGLILLNSTLHNNTAQQNGGGVAFGAAFAHLFVSLSTISGNTAQNGVGGGIATDSADQRVYFGGALVADNTAGGGGANCARSGGSFDNNSFALGYSIEDANTCSFDGASGDVVSTDPQLGALANNGGSTRNQAIPASSPARDMVPRNASTAPADRCSYPQDANSPNTRTSVAEDQRASPRPGGSSALCDAGAFEYLDADGDGVEDGVDNCTGTANASQANSDGDSQGDACDSDDDNDGLADSSDNCTTVVNADQANNDGDSQGDACDSDDDNDSVADGSDNCASIANTDQANNDGDSQGDACDADDDNDGAADSSDNCATSANADQANNDSDSSGDVCDADDDNDGDADSADNCPTVANADQRNSYGDARGDACEPDTRDKVDPVITDLTANPAEFVPTAKPGRAAGARAGSKVKFKLSEAATVTFKVYKRKAGRKVDGKCKKKTKSNAKKPKCDRLLSGSITFEGKKGKNSFSYNGWWKGKKLSAWRYRMAATAKDAAGNKGDAEKVAFTILEG